MAAMDDFDFDMLADQFIDVQFTLSVPRLNHLWCLINEWSRNSLEYDHGPIRNVVRQWRPGDIHPLPEDDPGDEDDHVNDGNDEAGDDHGNGGGGGGNLGGDDPGDDSGDDDDPGGGNVPPVGVVNGNLPPGIYDEDDFENDDGHPATGKRKRSSEKKKEKKKNKKRH